MKVAIERFPGRIRAASVGLEFAIQTERVSVSKEFQRALKEAEEVAVSAANKFAKAAKRIWAPMDLGAIKRFSQIHLMAQKRIDMITEVISNADRIEQDLVFKGIDAPGMVKRLAYTLHEFLGETDRLIEDLEAEERKRRAEMKKGMLSESEVDEMKDLVEKEIGKEASMKPETSIRAKQAKVTVDSLSKLVKDFDWGRKQIQRLRSDIKKPKRKDSK